MSQAYRQKQKRRKAALPQLEKEVRNKIKAGKLPRYVFGALGQQKLMMKRGFWKATVSGVAVRMRVDRWIPLTSTILAFAGSKTYADHPRDRRAARGAASGQG